MIGGNQTKMITGRRFAFPRWKPVWDIVLLLCVSAISGCGATPSSISAIRQQPQPTVVAQPFHATVKTFDGDFTLTLTITPNRSGTNVFTASVMDSRADRLATHVDIT